MALLSFLCCASRPLARRVMWRHALQVAEATKPDLARLVDFPAERYVRAGSNDLPMGATPGGRAEYRLSEGLGARRLQQALVRVHVQSLLVQSCSAIYRKEAAHMPDAAVATLIAAVGEIAAHARLVRLPLLTILFLRAPCRRGRRTRACRAAAPSRPCELPVSCPLRCMQRRARCTPRPLRLQWQAPRSRRPCESRARLTSS